ncbi:MAG: hypothetical protein WDM81_21455 [Rhizomicrobium sp.]
MNAAARALLVLSLAATAAVAATIPPPPPTPAGNTVDVVQGTRVADPYRWLEDWNDPKVKAWSDAQNARTRAYLDALPYRGAGRRQARQADQGGLAVLCAARGAWRPCLRDIFRSRIPAVPCW